jgi:ribosomal 50S subunit-associated protein YjgA (DUF615 family)
MTPQHIDIKLAHRIETGALKIGDDFTGYFIRSEDIHYLRDAIDFMLDNAEETWCGRHHIETARDFVDALRLL